MDEKDIRASEKDRRAAHVEALERELAGYEQKVKGARVDKDGDAESKYSARAEGVKKEIARVKKEGVTKGGEPPALGSPEPEDE